MNPLAQMGPYILRRRLGEGGMAEVFEAVHRDRPERPLALKTLPLEQRNRDDSSSRKIWAEAELGVRLIHPNIVRTVDMGRQGRHVYLVMELLEGVTLAQVIRCGDPLPWEWVACVALDLLNGLEYAHRLRTELEGGAAGLVHRDIKPSNLFVTWEGRAKVIDFGIAMVPGVDRTRTRTGLLRGSLPYCSPEQVRSEPLDPRTDLFSLGLVLHELLTAKRVFAQHDDAGILGAILWTPVPSVRLTRPEVPSEMDALITSLLDKDRARRPASAAEARDRLLTAMEKDDLARKDVISSRLRGLRLERRVDHVTVSERWGPAAEPLPGRGRHAGWRSAGTALAAVMVIAAVGAVATWRKGHALDTQRLSLALVDPSHPVAALPGPTLAPVRPAVAPVGPAGGAPARETPARSDPEPPLRHERALPQRPGWLTVGMRRGWAELSLEGKRLGPTPVVRYTLPPGSYHLSGRRPDGTQIQRVVAVRPGRESRVILAW